MITCLGERSGEYVREFAAQVFVRGLISARGRAVMEVHACHWPCLNCHAGEDDHLTVQRTRKAG